jgi:hypothetical protein
VPSSYPPNPCAGPSFTFHCGQLAQVEQLLLRIGRLPHDLASLGQVTADICAPLERRAGLLWRAAFLASVSLLGLGIAAVSYQIATGIGTWGLNTCLN